MFIISFLSFTKFPSLRHLVHGAQQVLPVGPPTAGKTSLWQALNGKQSCLARFAEVFERDRFYSKERAGVPLTFRKFKLHTPLKHTVSSEAQHT
eukprot:3109702-Amphidinium_carterae.1